MLTPYETTGTWTTLDQEATWLADFAAANPALVTVATVGTSVEGRPLRRVTVGTGTETVLIVAQQHGTEIAGRDASLQMMRDLVEDHAAHLATCRWVFFPTCNPDRYQTDYENAAGVNINTDHLWLTQPESRPIQQAITDHEPIISLDLHEGGNIDRKMATLLGQNPAIHTAITARSTELNTAIKAAMAANGWTHETYDLAGLDPVGPGFLRNAAPLRHATSLLIESRISLGRATRIAIHRAVLHATREWHAANHAAAAAASAASRAATATALPVVLDANGSTFTLTPPPSHYRLTDTQHEATATPRAILEIDSTAEEDWRVPLAQPARHQVGYLLDPASPLRMAVGTRLYLNVVPDPDPDPPPSGAHMVVDGEWVQQSVQLVVDGVWTPVVL